MKNKVISFSFQLLKHKAELNFVNEHGNTPLHYATFWNYPIIAEDLVEWGALVTIENKYGETPLEKCQASLGKKLHGNTYLQCLQSLWMLFEIIVQKVFDTNLNFRYQQVRNHQNKRHFCPFNFKSCLLGAFSFYDFLLVGT